jgi:pimeloyl-ACP methyl ester carboxylesterase
VAIIPGAGHFVFAEAPQGFGSTVKAFLRESEIGRRGASGPP